MYGVNNYGYNPYGRYVSPQPIQQPIQQSIQQAEQIQPLNNAYKLNGKLVPDLETVKSIEYPLDGSTSYFPLTDGSAIVTKQLQMDGTSKTIIYKPSEDTTKMPQYATVEDLKESINSIDLSDIDDLKEDMKDIKKEIKDLKKKNKGD